MSYPGNPSLAPDVQQRILTTYRQSVQSAQQGNRDEALLGCDFVLRLDPQFGPARALQQMLAAGRPPEAFAALLADESGGEGGGEGSDDLRATFNEMLESRRFAEILNAAERDKRRVAGDAELRRLIEVAQSRYEADPYVAKFVDSAELAVRSARESEALALLEKARALDPTHPRVTELERMMGMYADPSRAMGNRRRGISMEEEATPAIDDDAFALPDLDLPFALPDAAQAGFGGQGGQSGLGAASDPERGAEETSGRIAQLLVDGQSAFDRGEFQGAIDAWSRIFLIDIDHEEAARKIERARQLKAEREREVEEIFHEGVGKFDAGDLDGARAAFGRVLEVQPSYVLAREYLEKIDERAAGGDLPGAGLPSVAAAAGASGATAAAPASKPAASRRPSGEVTPGAERAPREGRRVAAPGFAATAKRRAGGPSPRFLVIGGGVLALLAVGGWLLYENRHRLFPNAQAADAPAAPEAGDPIARAKALHEQGKTAVAVGQLRRLPPNDPGYAEAQSLVSQWERIAGPDESDGSDPLAAARRRALLAEAQQALADGENFRARRLFERAAEVAPLDGDWVAMAAAAEERLSGLAQEARLFKDGDYEYLLNQLWRRREAEPNNRDITRMIADAYFNLGVLDLQRGDPGSAREKFREARAIDGADQSLQRLERFAVAYEQREQDLLYRIFVKYLVVR